MKRLLLVAVMVLVSLVGVVGFSRDAESQNEPLTMSEINNAVRALEAIVNARVPASAKMYYLTVTGFTGGDAITACDSGFHMASISEIQDPSNLQYATGNTAAYDSLVDGQRLGPPTNHMGWVRAGANELTENDDSCNVYHTDSDSLRTTTMSLYSFWYDARHALSTSNLKMWWHMAHTACSLPKPVWCIEDPA